MSKDTRSTKKAGKPTQPPSRLRSLESLVGSWELSGPEIVGQVTFKWFTGNWYLVQRGWLEIWGRKIQFIEYIGHDKKRCACVSHLFDNFGNLFTYEWKVSRTEITIWFGRKGSENYFRGKFAKDGQSYSGAWKWPGGGYEATATRL